MIDITIFREKLGERFASCTDQEIDKIRVLLYALTRAVYEKHKKAYFDKISFVYSGKWEEKKYNKVI